MKYHLGGLQQMVVLKGDDEGAIEHRNCLIPVSSLCDDQLDLCSQGILHMVVKAEMHGLALIAMGRRAFCSCHRETLVVENIT